MFKLYEITGSGNKEVKDIDGIYTVYEFVKYQLQYTDAEIYNSTFFIEDEPIPQENISRKTNKEIITKPYCYFEDYFGFAKISINNESFQVNILIEKLKVSEIEEILLYLFENNHYVLDKFISKSSYKGAISPNGKGYNLSSKYLNIVNEFCTSFEQLFISFKNIPHTVVRKKFQLSNYNDQPIDFKSIEWLLQNLDTIYFDDSFSEHPDSIKILSKTGLIDKIGAELNQLSFNNYENETILGAFKYLQNKLNTIKAILNHKIGEYNSKDDQQEPTQYSDFRQLKKIPFIRLKSNLLILEKRLSIISTKYSNLFKDTKPLNVYPKLTPVFAKYKHYQKAFNQIRNIRNFEYNLEGEIQLLNIKKLSELYEIYNLSIMIEEIKNVFDSNNQFELCELLTSQNDTFISKISYKKKNGSYKFSLYYEPLIKKETDQTDLITIANTELSINGTYCKPDYVIEVNRDGQKKYCIIDSKYSKIRIIESMYKTSCIKKYIIDIGISGNPYQKPDFLILLHPDSTDKQISSFYNKSYFPKIETIISKPNHTDKLRQLIRDFV